jgi:hypothetical protein
MPEPKKWKVSTSLPSKLSPKAPPGVFFRARAKRACFLASVGAPPSPTVILSKALILTRACPRQDRAANFEFRLPQFTKVRPSLSSRNS